MTNLEERVVRLEGLLRGALQDIRTLQAQVGTIQQNQFAAQTPFGGGGGGNNTYVCVLTGGITAAGVPGTGAPAGPLASQTVYTISAGGFTSITTSADVYNGLPNPISSGASCLLSLNSDGSYTVEAVAC